MNFEVRSDLRGCLEAAMASEATMAVRGNMHMDARVIKVADFKSKVIYIYIYMTSEVVWRLPWPRRPPRLLEAICT